MGKGGGHTPEAPLSHFLSSGKLMHLKIQGETRCNVFFLSGYLLFWLLITIIIAHCIDSLLWARRCWKHYKDFSHLILTTTLIRY